MNATETHTSDPDEERHESDEAALWPHVREAAMNEPGSVAVEPIAESVGLGAERAREIVAEWADRDLVVALSGGYYAILTEKGRGTESIGE